MVTMSTERSNHSEENMPEVQVEENKKPKYSVWGEYDQMVSSAMPVGTATHSAITEVQVIFILKVNSYLFIQSIKHII